MFRTVGYVFVVLAIGTLAIAWSRTPQPKLGSATTIAPHELQLASHELPAQKLTDLTFVFASED
jgi:hypothetical protein